ncbi:MAG: xylulokinase [Lachnospiraceae bacterium]|jgi:sugar (pentulose or hexulose) kinase
MNKESAAKIISDGKAVLGMELGSTRIKAVLIDAFGTVLASGEYGWENKLINDIWTYDLEDVWTGVQASYADLCANVKAKYDTELSTFDSIGFSGMMHGYLAFDKDGNLLVPFRTWRNNITLPATQILTPLLGQQMPQRWSVSHLYQAILNEEPHVKDVAYITTLSGYLHWKFTGRKVLGIGDAAGMFPIDSEIMDFNAEMVKKFDELIADKNFGWKLKEILPEVLVAGEDAGTLTEEGAKLIDPTGTLRAGIPLCPPEGDAGTGMVATNSVAKRTGNVSAGTSIFGMVVMEKSLSKVYECIDMVTTPDGSPVAMVHCQNCATDIDSWVRLLSETLSLFGKEVSAGELYTTLFKKSLEGDPDCGGLLTYNYHSGEHITEFTKGRPLFVRKPDDKFNLANFMRANIYSTMGALKIGMDILIKEEGVKIDRLMGHGGLFKTEGVAQNFLAGAMNAPVEVMATAGEGGAWGIALLASFMKNRKDGETLPEFLDSKIFADAKSSKSVPDAADVEGFEKFMKNYRSGLAIERAAVDNI